MFEYTSFPLLNPQFSFSRRFLMIRVKMKTDVNTSADELWNLISDFNGLPKFVEAATASRVDKQGVGAVRTLTLADGAQIKERLEELDNSERKLVYSILEGPLPVEDYIAEMQVVDLEKDKSELIWSSTFNPKGAPENDAKAAIEGIYNMGFKGINKLFN
jgi:hypothetical protein